MRAKEFLFEYKRDITAQRLGPKLAQSGQREGITDVDQILSALEDMDPTPNKQYVVWIANQYITGKFRLEDSDRIQKLLTNFGTIKSRLPEKDINRYDLHKLENAIDQAMGSGSELGSSDALAAGTFPVVPNSKILYNGPLGQLSIPKTEEASCELGRGTKWCTAAKSKNMFTHYDSQGPLYVWRDKDGSKYQFHFPSKQFMDSRDREISGEKLRYFRTKHPVLKKLFANQEKFIVENPGVAVEYARDVIRDRWPEAEKAIANDPESAYEYAKDVIQDRWPEAEKVIATDPRTALWYASEVIQDRWPEAEEVIIQAPNIAVAYARDVIKGRWPEAEKAIVKNPDTAYWYAEGVIQDRWPEAEEVIAKDPQRAAAYAQYVIRGRWPEAEEVIATDRISASQYATYVIKGRWPKKSSPKKS